MLLSLQNGYDNAERLQAALGRPVHAAVVYVATEMAGPGHLRHHGRGELVIGPFTGSAEVVAEFAAAGVPVQVSDNVAGALWAKLIINCVPTTRCRRSPSCPTAASRRARASPA
jgi:2-dehydropantoate 2-reductase